MLPTLVEQMYALTQNAPPPAKKPCPPKQNSDLRRTAAVKSIRTVLAGKGWRSASELAISLGRERSNVGTTIRRILAHYPGTIEQSETPGAPNSPWGHRTVHVYRWIGD
jgi:hypothetical protein